MFIINKKRIYIILLSLLVATAVFEAKIGNRNKEKSIETIALPVSSKVIVLDAGHGYPDEGAESNNNVSEASINLNIVLKVQNLLEQSNATVVLTRSDEYGIYDVDAKTIKEKKISDLKNRVEIGNNSGADIFVSVHLNKIPQEKYWGWQTFFREKDEESIKLAKSIQEALNSSIQKENKRESLKLEGKYIIDNVHIPIAVVECGFLSNAEEEKLLQTNEYQDKLAWGIYIGIMNYFY